MKLGITVPAPVLVLLAVCGCSEAPAAAPGAVHIRLATAFARGHILTEVSERFKANLEADAGGAITVEVIATAASEEEVNTRTAQGMFDMQATGGPPLQAFAPQYFFFNGPYVVRDYAHFLKLWKGKLGDQARGLVRDKGNMVALATVYRGLRQTTSRRPIKAPADLVGLRLRLPAVPTWTAVWTALEAQPVPVALPELYASLRDGTTEASEGDLAQIASLKLAEVQSHLSLTNHLVGIGWIFAHRPFFDRLPDASKRMIENAIGEAAAWATEKMTVAETQLLQTLRAAGMTIVDPDADAIRRKAKPAVDDLFRTEWPVTTWDEVLAQ